jgi:predicted PurR-regulated permease PerM
LDRDGTRADTVEPPAGLRWQENGNSLWMKQTGILKAAAVLATITLVAIILVYAKPFMVPLTFAALLSMLLLPVTKWLQSRKIGHVPAILMSILLFLSFFALVIFFVTWQMADLAKDTSKIEQQVSSKYQQAKAFISEKIGVPPQKQEEMMKEQQKSSGGKMSGAITSFLAGLSGVVTDFILVIVYIFLFIFFRDRLKGFLIRIVPDDQKDNAMKILSEIQKVTQKYLTGLAFMIVLLWIMYGVGFSIAGVESPLFFAVLCGLLEIIPFVGNLVGTALTLGMSLIQGGGTNLIIGILITYALVQFIQTYILEPLIVGAEVNINPLFTIVGLVAGETLWGIPGMILAIPLLGITKIICDRVEPLKPWGYLIGQEKKEDKGLKKKMKELFKRKK